MGQFDAILISAVVAATVVLLSAQSPSFPLHQAAADRDLAKVKLLVSKGYKVNAKGPDNFSVLHSAIDSLNRVLSHPEDPKLTEVVKYLLSQGADPKIPFPLYAGIKGYTLLHFMAYDGNMVIVPLLVGKGAKVNAKDERGYTPAMAAAKCDFRLSCDDCSKAPSLWKAGAVPTIKYLISKGANLKIKGKDGKTALDLVPKLDCPKTFGFLQKLP